MELIASFSKTWSIQGDWTVSYQSAVISDKKLNEVIHFGLVNDFFNMLRGNELLKEVLSGKHSHDSFHDEAFIANNEWYFWPHKSGLAVEHQWNSEFQKEYAFWFTWEFVNAVGLLADWCFDMRNQKYDIEKTILNSSTFQLTAPLVCPSDRLIDLGWRSMA